MAIDIKGLDKVEVLRALYMGTRPLGLGILHDRPTGLTREEAKTAIDACTRPDGSVRLDYVAGRPIKVTFRGDAIDSPALFDRDAGAGACQAAVDALRSGEHGAAAAE